MLPREVLTNQTPTRKLMWALHAQKLSISQEIYPKTSPSTFCLHNISTQQWFSPKVVDKGVQTESVVHKHIYTEEAISLP